MQSASPNAIHTEDIGQSGIARCFFRGSESSGAPLEIFFIAVAVSADGACSYRKRCRLAAHDVGERSAAKCLKLRL
jgi:hypothetical protein